MAETQRTWANLLTVLPDNTNREISPQDLRDGLYSFKTDHGELVAAGNVSETVISVQSTYYAATFSNTTLSGFENNFSSDATGRLRYDGAQTRTFRVSAAISVLGAAAFSYPATIAFRLAVNGITVSRSTQSIVVRSASPDNAFIQGLVRLNNNQFLELHVSNETNTNNVIVYQLNMIAMGFIDG